ncbi:odorant receptor 4-like [Manduca sexta]|uniref:odorant receptor 4-like n=1 Tax=Manduca sexta TaxID=7130 RepID=UPI0018904FEF|nr:odorant receptor 4-like [Manduca sexta]
MGIPAYEDFLRQIKINMWVSGIPFGDTKIYIRYYILLSLLISMIIAEGSFFVSRISSENFLELTQLAPCACIGLLSFLKILPITVKRRKIFDLTERLGRLYENILDDTTKKAIVKRELHLLSLLTKYFFVLNAVLISVYNFSSPIIMLYQYIAKNKVVFVLPYAVLLPFPTDGWLSWFLAFVYSATCGCICVLFFTTIDVLYCVLTSHVCNNFSIISDQLQHLQVNNVNIIGNIVKEHQYILKLADDLEDIFTAPNLFNVLVGSVEICALGFNLTTGNLAQLPGTILFLTSVLLQILVMSVFGENIITESRKIGESAFLCKWYEMDEKSKKMILTIMIRSRKPQILTAYKFSIISYGSFSKIISTSWSYFTILQTVYKPPEINREQ